MSFNRDAFVLDTFLGPIAFASIPKCGQHTLAKYQKGMIPHSNLRRFPIRAAFIREPFDRFLSAFHFSAQTGYIIDGHRIHSYSQFVDIALNSDDEHVMPQCRLIDHDLFALKISVSIMSDVLSRLTGVEITVENASRRDNFDASYMKSEVIERYSEDSKLFSDCLTEVF